jgi:hypothetical protein
VKRETSSERRMIVEDVVTIAGKMTGNFEDVESDRETSFVTASERGERDAEKKKAGEQGDNLPWNVLGGLASRRLSAKYYT